MQAQFFIAFVAVAIAVQAVFRTNTLVRRWKSTRRGRRSPALAWLKNFSAAHEPEGRPTGSNFVFQLTLFFFGDLT